jgi:glycosyltransferase involved in cell wall biosynthesis
MVIPLYNEAERFDLEYWKIRTKNESIYHYFIDDGSNDGTFELLSSLARQAPMSIKVIQLPKNAGKAEALRYGLLHALDENPDVEIIGYCDGDSTVISQDVVRLLNLMNERNIDVMLGSRVMLSGRQIKRTPIRHFIGRIIVSTLGVGHRNFPYDPQNGFKLFRNSALFRKSLEEPFRTRWFIDIELMLRIRQYGLDSFWEEPLMLWEESEGSHLSFRSIPRILYEMVIVRRLLRKWI